jgi:cyclopropane-fatty-acyl-phospholipid synthase
MIASLLGIRGGERVLDIGCGWGSLTVYLAETHHCHVTSVTPSAVQARYVQERAERAGCGDRVRVVHGLFQEVGVETRAFDAVTFVGVMEHMPEHREPLAKAYAALRQGGRLYLSSSCYRSRAMQQEYEPRPGSMHAVQLYGFTAMTPLSQLVEEMEDAGFSLTALTDLTAHYERTMSQWQERIAARRDDIEAAVPGFGDDINHYLDVARASWGYTAKHYALAAIRSRLGEARVPGSPLGL